MNPHDRRIATGLFLVAFVTYAWFFGGGGWNLNAHFDLTRAVVERRTLHIDGYHVNTGDISTTDAHVYINKPPGASLLGAIPYAAIHAVERALDLDVDRWLVITINAYLVTVLTCGGTGALIPVVLYLYARRRAGASQRTAVAVALTVAFGTIVFPYATIFFAHVPSALFLLLAFVWLDDRPILAGAAAGLAASCFYLCVPAAAILAIAAGRKILHFIAGGVPFAIVLCVYQWICFGSPWTIPLEASTPFTEEGLWLGVIRAPSAKALWGITFAESHGLFWVSPVLLLVVIGAGIMIRRRVMLRELAVIGAIATMFVVLVASFNGWHGGHAFGPRYLLSMIPLFAVPLLFVPLRALAAPAIFSAALQLLAAAVTPIPPNIDHPIRALLLPAFIKGNVTPEVAKGIGAPHGHIGKVAVNPQAVNEYCATCTYPPGSHESVWSSFNLGELLVGPARRSSVLPVVLWMIGGSSMLLRRAAHGSLR